MIFPVTVTFDDGYNLCDGQFELNAILLSGLTVTSIPAKILYRKGERISYSGLAVTATYSDESTQDVTSKCSITPLENSVFDSDTAAEISYREGQDEQSTSLQLIHLYLTGLNITQQPAKTVYKTGEIISYDGLAVTASYSDGSEKDVTASCSISPAAGKTFDPDTDSQVEITYDDVETAAASLSLTANTVTRITVTSNPLKTWYRSGEAIDYTGLAVTAAYSDGSTEDITDICSITPQAGKHFDPSSDSYVNISFVDNASVNIELHELYITDVSLSSNPDKTSYKYGETIDYTGLAVTAAYSDGTTEDITDSCSISPAEGKAFDPDTDTSVLITYSEGLFEHSASLSLTAVTLNSISITSNPDKTTYRYGESIDYAGLVITASYSDGSSADVTSLCSISPEKGKAFDPDTDTSVTITYSELGSSDLIPLSFFLNAITFTGLSVSSYPVKTSYKFGQFIDYTGLTVTASYSDGSSIDVTALCAISPADGKAFNPDTDSDVSISYSEPSSSGIITENLEISLTPVYFTGLAVSSYPAKTSYRFAEAIDYSGLAITASYSYGSSADVTRSCSISPKEGKAFDPNNDSTVNISYSERSSEGTITENLEISLTAVILSGLSVSSHPAKTAYIQDEPIDYTGMIVTASYSDGSSIDVTDSCSISPTAGKHFDPDNDSNVEITYSEGSITENASFMLSEIYMTGLQVTSLPRKTAYKHDQRISYTGLVVSANYSDGSSADVTSECDITPRRNKKFDADTDSYVEISYSQGNNEASCTFSLTPITLTSIALTSYPDNTAYSQGEAISYSGIAVTASYSDSSEDNVTDKCVFSPPSGKAFSPDTDTTVTITYSEGQSEQSCTLFLTETAPMTLVVAAMPDKTSYNPGEPLDFTGAVIQSQFQDGTMHNVTDFCEFYADIVETLITVTAKCAHTAAPLSFDFSNGYVDGCTWVFDEASTSFSDIYRVKAGHKYLLILDENVGSRFKVMFTTADVSKASANVTGTSITDTSNPAIYTGVEYTPSSNGYIVVTKDSNGKTGIKTYLYDADCSVKNVTAQFMLTTVAVTALAVTKPVKTRYRTGEKFDYTGAVVTATYSDGSVVDVTEYASFSPVNGSTAVSDNPATIVTTQVLVSYGGLYAGFDVTMGGIAIMSLSATPPNKISYRTGEPVDYTGCEVTAVYWDGSEKDVTASVIFQPPNGSPVNKYELDETSNLPVSVSYQETDEILCSNVHVDNVDYDYSNVYDKDGQTMDYASTYSIQASVKYLDTKTGQTGTKTFNLGDFTEAPYIDSDSYLSYEVYADLLTNGRWFGWWKDGQFIRDSFDTAITALTVRELYRFGQVNGLFGYFVRTFHDLYPVRVSQRMGSGDATVDWFAENFAGRYPLGETFVPLMPVYYDSHASCTLYLTAATLLPTLSFTPPEKTVYHYREHPEYNGYSAYASYSNGFTEDVTDLVTFSPITLSILFYSESARASYYNAGGDYAESSFQITVLRLSRIAVNSPEKTSYRQGEAIDYTGATVTAIYSDGSMVDVTSSATFSPADGTVITEDMTGSINVSVSYTDEWGENAKGSFSLSIVNE